MDNRMLGSVTAAADLAIDALAVHRLTRLITQDHLTEEWRENLIARLDDSSYPKLALLPGCYWCTGMWVASGVVCARTLFPRVWSPVARALAFSTVAGVIADR
jgi:hypothetical protein